MMTTAADLHLEMMTERMRTIECHARIIDFVCDEDEAKVLDMPLPPPAAATLASSCIGTVLIKLA